MPDEYGRPTGDDFVKVARGLREYNEGVKKEDEERGLGLGLGELDAASREGRAAVRPAGTSPTGWVKSQDAHGKAKAGMLLADQAGQALEETKLASEFMVLAGKAKTPEERLRALGQVSPKSLAGAKALASVQKQVLGTQDNQVALLKSMMGKGQAEYDNVVRPALVAASDLYNDGKGDEEGAANVLSAVSKTLPLRGEYRWNPNTKTLDHFHNVRDAGLQPQAQAEGADGATPAPSDGKYYTGKSLTVKDALDAMGKMSREDYALQMAGHRATNMEFNAKALETGGHVATGPKGEKLRVVPLINLNDSTRQFAVFDEAGTHTATLGNDEFMKRGIRIVTKEQRALDNDERKVNLEAAKLGMQREALGLRQGASEGKTKSLLEMALADREKAAAQAQKNDPFLDSEEAGRQADSTVFHKYTIMTGREVKSYDDLRGMMPKEVRQPGATPTPSRSVAQTESAPPAAAFSGLKPGQSRSFKNTETGEVQTWTVDPVSQQPVRVKGSVKKGGGNGLGSDFVSG